MATIKHIVSIISFLSGTTGFFSFYLTFFSLNVVKDLCGE